MMPFQKVNQIKLEAEYAVPTPSLPPRVHRGSIPGHPNAAETGFVFKLCSRVLDQFPICYGRTSVLARSAFARQCHFAACFTLAATGFGSCQPPSSVVMRSASVGPQVF